MKYIFSTHLMLFAVITTPAQVRQQAGKANVNAAPGGIIEAKDLPATETQGTIYLIDEWVLGNIYLKSEKEIAQREFRYDVEHNRFELKFNSQIRVLSGTAVSGFEFNDTHGKSRRYESLHKYVNEEEIVSGFIEVLVDGDPGLLCKTNLKLVKANYVVALDVGDHSDKLVKQYKYYLLLSQSLVEVPRSKKKFFQLFPNITLRLREYVKQNSLDIKDKKDLKKVIEFLKTLKY